MMSEEFTLFFKGALSFFSVLCGGWVGGIFYSEMIGEIFAGVLLGPLTLDLVPFSSSITFIGQIGLVLLIIEAGLHFQISTIQESGIKVVLAATTGVVLPLIICPVVLWLLGASILESFAGAACMSSTSIGFAVTLLQKQEMLDTPLGQIISGAAMLDDVESLVLLGLFSSWNSSSGLISSLINAVIPILSSFLLLCIGLLLCWSLPDFSELLLEIEQELKSWYINKKNASQTNQEQEDLSMYGIENRVEVPQRLEYPLPFLRVMTLLLGAFFVLFSIQIRTTHLLGAFVTGLAMSRVPRAKEAFGEISSHVEVLMSVFFFSVGFLVPLRILLSWDVLLLGIAFTIPSILTKLVIGSFEKEWNSRLVLGWAMVGRGEVGFMMASSSYASGILSQRIFLIIIWALAISTSLAPFPFQYYVKKIKNQEDN